MFHAGHIRLTKSHTKLYGDARCPTAMSFRYRSREWSTSVKISLPVGAWILLFLGQSSLDGFVCIGIDGHTISHLCRMSGCVLPHHFVAESMTDNNTRNECQQRHERRNHCTTHAIPPWSSPCFPRSVGNTRSIFGQPTKEPRMQVQKSTSGETPD